MRLEDQIRALEQERAGELDTIRRHTKRAVREAKRALSPDRAIRRHIGMVLMAAAVAGMAMAPAPKFTKKSDIREEMRKVRKGGGQIWDLLGHFVPGVNRFRPKQEEPAPEPKRGGGLMGMLLGQVFSILASRINWQELLHQVVNQGKQAAGAPEHDGHAPDDPHFSVGDVGTGRAAG